MSKRIKVFSDAEVELIKLGQIDYLEIFSPEHLTKDDEDSGLNREALIKKYKMIENQRVMILKSHNTRNQQNMAIGFHCQPYVE